MVRSTMGGRCVRRPASGLGEHTAEVLREALPADAAQLAKLLAGSGPGVGAAPPGAG